jgi:hypothetical protein
MPPIPHVARFQKPEAPKFIDALLKDRGSQMKFTGLFQAPFDLNPR